jgi:hypothetical protein
MRTTDGVSRLARVLPGRLLWNTFIAAIMIAVVLLATVSAQATITRMPLFQLGAIPTVGPHGETVPLPGALGKMESMTVDAGHLWVAEGKFGEDSRVDEFDAATGAFLAQPIHVEAPSISGQDLPTGYGYGYGEGIAVGHGPGEAAVYIGGEQHGVSVVSVFNEAGQLKATWNGGGSPAGSFGFVTDVAVDNSTSVLDQGKGDVFVALESEKVIDIFHPETDGEERYVGQITGVSPSEPFLLPSKLAVDETNGDLLVMDRLRRVVDVFEPTGLGAYAFVRKISGPPGGSFGGPYTFAVDPSNGETFVADEATGGEYASEKNYLIDEFDSRGSYLGHVEDIPDAYAIAVDPESHYLYAREVVYGLDVVIPDVTTGPVSNLQPESVTLDGTVNPDGAGAATCEFEWGTSPSFGKVAPCTEAVPNGEGQAVQAQLTGLERDATYYYRLRASNANGTNPGEIRQDQQFSTNGVLIRGASISNVSATTGTLAATINPGSTPTSYYFQYGTGTAYGQDAPAAPGASIGAGAADVEVPTVTVRGLVPDTLYHYRVVAVSEAKPGELETVRSGDYTFTTQAAGGAFALADGRQWELVSPASKLGAEIFDPEGFGFGLFQAAATGDGIAYRAATPTEGEPAGNDQAVTVLSARGAGGWSSLDISPPHERSPSAAPTDGEEFQAFSEDLSVAAVQPTDRVFTPLSPQASEQTTYLRTDFPEGSAEAFCRSSCYRPLVTSTTGFANVPPGTVFGGMPDGLCETVNRCGPQFIGASPDLSHVVLVSPVQLTARSAPAGGPGLYEWADGKLQLLDMLPKGEEGPAVLAGTGSFGVRHSISRDGNRVVLEGGATGGEGLYMRDVETSETLRLDAPQGGPGPSAQGRYMDASSDASRVFFLDSGRLTANASATGTDLYEYDLNAPADSRLSDLTADPNTGQAANVAMVIGTSEDGSYVYFAAAGALAPGADAGECPESTGQPGEETQHCNLYVRHEGVTRLIAALPRNDIYDWRSPNGGLQARVSPDGQWLAFLSEAELTAYDTHDAVSGQRDVEVYLYDASTDRLVCVSCNPSGARPVGSIEADNTVVPGLSVAARVPGWERHASSGQQFTVRQPRYLSDSGRLFFDSVDVLVPKDVNGVEDVYEYEPTSTGSCTAASTAFAERSDGCVNLVSSGTSPVASEFMDASESGGDVFFLTQARLAPQDYDTAYDVYDAHECTNTAPCVAVPPAPPSCDTEASCKASPTPQPALYGTPASATFSGTGNLTPTVTRAAEPKAKRQKQKAVKCRRRAGRRLCTKTKKVRSARRKGKR